MARGDQLGRQWKIIQTLISSRRGKSAADLAQDLECHPRTLYRDLEALQVAGFHADVAGYIKEKIWHESQQIHPQDDGSIIFEGEVAGIDEIRFWIMTWGSKAEVFESASLMEEVRAEAEMMANRYGAPIVAEESQPYGPTKDYPLQRS